MSLYLALAEQEHRLREAECLTHVVRHVERRHLPLVPDAEEVWDDPLAEPDVESSERFIEQQESRITRQRPRERHALLLPAREGGRIPVEQGFQPQGLDGGAAPVFRTSDTKAHISHRREVWKEPGILRHVAHAAAFRPQPRTGPRVEENGAVDHDTSPCLRTQPRDGFQQ